MAGYYDSGTTTSTAVTWVAWNTVYDSTGITFATGTSTWTAWNNVIYSDTSATVATPTVWHYWNSEVPAALTAEQLAENARIAREREAEYLQRAAEQAKIAQEANRRAAELLQSHLSVEQRTEFEREKTFTVIGKNGQRRYRIRKGWAGNIDELDKDGKRVAILCGHAIESVPEGDNMLAQKLMLEHDEDQFLKIANRRAG